MLSGYLQRNKIMTEDNVKTRDRRSVIKEVLRYITLAFLGFAAAGAIVKKRRLLKEGKCLNRGICAGCGVYSNCRLPQAMSRKQTLSE